MYREQVLVIAAFFVFIIVVILPMKNSQGSQIYKPCTSLRIVAINLMYDNTSKGKVESGVQEFDPDVIVLIEWTNRNFILGSDVSKQYRLVAGNQSIYNDAHPKQAAHGIGIIVRNEVKAEGMVVQSPIPGPYQMPYVVCRSTLFGDPVTIIAIHAPPPISKWTTRPSIRYIVDQIANGKLANDFASGRKGDRVIIVGDFNSMPLDPIFTAVKKVGLKDAARVVSIMPGPTWKPAPFLPPLIRIDYMFIPNDMRVNNFWTKDISGSDHRALIMDIRKE